METLQRYAKLDEYDYELIYKDGRVTAIHIPIKSLADVLAADVSSDIDVHNGFIYVEGHYLLCRSLTIITDKRKIKTNVERNLIVIRTTEL